MKIENYCKVKLAIKVEDFGAPKFDWIELDVILRLGGAWKDEQKVSIIIHQSELDTDNMYYYEFPNWFHKNSSGTLQIAGGHYGDHGIDVFNDVVNVGTENIRINITINPYYSRPQRPVPYTISTYPRKVKK